MGGDHTLKTDFVAKFDDLATFGGLGFTQRSRQTLKQYIMLFQVKITQVNSKGAQTFSAKGQFNADSGLDIAVEIADFAKSTINTVNKLSKLGVKGLSRARVKLSQSANFEIICVDDETSASFEVANFGKFVADNLNNKKVQTAIELLVEHTQNFADRWTA